MEEAIVKEQAEDKFIQGYCCAIANIINSHGCNTPEIDAMKCLGIISADILKAKGVEQSDIDVFKKEGIIKSE